MLLTTPDTPARHDADHVPPRAIGFWGGLSANLLNMIGIGPFITIPLALSALAGPMVLLGWVAGALLCLCDGLVWAELGSAIPKSGGPYHYLREAYGRERLGRLFGFLYLWQTLLTAPLSIGAAAVGFTQYLAFLVPGLAPWQLTAIAAALCLFNTALLYREVRSVQVLSLLVTAAVVAAVVWIVISGVLHFDMAIAVALIMLASWGSALVVLLGYSRVPYAAAAEGQFFRVFARLHPRGRFPTVSLLFVGATSALACLLSLDDLIATLMVIQIMFQFMAQCLAVVLLRRQAQRPRDAFSMPLYPWPLWVSVAGWLYILATSQGRHLLAAVVALCVGTALFFIQARRQDTWPWVAR
ncbi:APC family permease [Xanthomonas translucens pv. translucens]|uniref:Amino acid permease n=2 Tax=Xanthomonas campestris pv. translucens TaxID=343 RepID=A0A109HK03_XANCT|nr:APC family permease [Xanthomonas translucens]KWV13561.1 amino acid permease [Xanthomonas translucens]MCC8444885.1 APC family permease [Xanthomonas translucens pv. translucens]MCT8287608.1 APC family permease [Xanthomonas translucens pv. translucens]MCT8305266.1 APC family permease [Xanthomonas translucens pv. translucens]QSQ30477.1 amino acid permease [Xanthomonas translucens pv. translucens]